MEEIIVFDSELPLEISAKNPVWVLDISCISGTMKPVKVRNYYQDIDSGRFLCFRQYWKAKQVAQKLREDYKTSIAEELHVLSNAVREIPFTKTYVARLLPEVYEKAPHVFRYGAGRETMAYWWKQVTGRTIRPSIIRQVLEEQVAARKFVKLKNFTGHTRYIMVTDDAMVAEDCSVVSFSTDLSK
jgi:hypothetical protein